MRRVTVLYADRSGCGYYRGALPAAVVNNHSDLQVTMTDKLYGKFGQDGQTTMLPDLMTDTLVLQRPLAIAMATAIPLARAQGVRTVVELDDDFEHVHPLNAAYREVQPQFSPRSNHRLLRQAVAAADQLTCTTPALARLYESTGTPAEVIPNYVPREWTFLPKIKVTPVEGSPVAFDPDRLRLGWAGSLSVHPTDLQVLGSAVNQALSTTNAVFRHIGGPDGVFAGLGLGSSHSFETTGWVDLDTYPAAVGSLDVGIVPLAPTGFNDAKSWLKGLEMAALGVPFVASPTAEYVRLRDQFGIGLLAATPKDWRKQLMRLLTDHDYRAEVSQTWRDTVRQQLTIQGHADEWIRVWSTTGPSARYAVADRPLQAVGG